MEDNVSGNAPVRQMLADAAKKTLEYPTMKFALVYEKGNTKVSGVKLTKAHGDIQRPGKLQALAKGKLGFFAIDVKATVIGNQAWVRATGTSKDLTLSGALEHIFADPLLLLADIVGAMENPMVTSHETTKGEARTWISGTFNPSLIHDAEVRRFLEKIGPKPIDIALDGEGRIVSMRLRGSFLSEDSGNVIRRIDLSGFGTPVSISAP